VFEATASVTRLHRTWGAQEVQRLRNAEASGEDLNAADNRTGGMANPSLHYCEQDGGTVEAMEGVSKVVHTEVAGWTAEQWKRTKRRRDVILS